MTAAGRVVPADDLRGRRVEEQHGDLVPAGADLPDATEQFVVIAARDEREAGDVAARFRGEVDDRLDQRGRQVVDDVPAEILQYVRGSRSAGSGQPGDEHDLGHGSSVGGQPVRRSRR